MLPTILKVADYTGQSQKGSLKPIDEPKEQPLALRLSGEHHRLLFAATVPGSVPTGDETVLTGWAPVTRKVEPKK
jgi:hypothetical protein